MELTSDQEFSLEEKLLCMKIELIHQQFNLSVDNKLDELELTKMLIKDWNINATATEFHLLFLKLNVNGTGRCTWNEFLSYLIYYYQLYGSGRNQKNVEIKLPIDETPHRKKTFHQNTIVQIRFCPLLTSNGTFLNEKGNFLTISKDGTINTWTIDFHNQRTDKANNPFLSTAKTWIVDFVVMPDVRIVCTASIEQDIRFYDTIGDRFRLCLIITNFKWSLNCMHYWFEVQPRGENINLKNTVNDSKTSKLTIGDTGGNIIFFEFQHGNRAPFIFQSGAGSEFLHFKWKDFRKSELSSINVRIFPKIHNKEICQVKYCQNLNAIFSCSVSDKNFTSHNFDSGVVITPLGVDNRKIFFKMPNGAQCFAINHNSNYTAATGGPDCILRLWNHTVPQKPLATLIGHTSNIINVFIHRETNKLYTIDKIKTIKVWNAMEQQLIQTFSDFSSILPERHFTTLYHDLTDRIIFGGMHLAMTKCERRIDLNVIDTRSYAHTKTVSVVLYNELFKTLITCGHDSCIMVWNLLNGNRLMFIQNAHTQQHFDDISNCEITAACLDPQNHFLLTGAGDGTMKFWNLIDGTCDRNLAVTPMCKITDVFWTKEFILVLNFNKTITQFSNLIESNYEKGLEWPVVNHSDNMIASAKNNNSVVCICDNQGYLELWNLIEKSTVTSKINFKLSPNLIKLKLNDADNCNVTVNCILFLSNRRIEPNCGSLIVSLTNGIIQIYSEHSLGTYIDCFKGIHRAGDSIVALATDQENRYLFTGTSFGYIKTWLITNYGVPENLKVHINLPELRLKFPFLINDFWIGHAKRSVRSFNNPMLVNCYRGHTNLISRLCYCNDATVLVSSSDDLSVRMWTLGGQYIRTFGLPDLSTINNFKFHIPPDINPIASSTTLKVLNGVSVPQGMKKNTLKRRPCSSRTGRQIEDFRLYGKQVNEPILGSNYKHLPHVPFIRKPIINTRTSSMLIYKHLHTYEAKILKIPKFENKEQN